MMKKIELQRKKNLIFLFIESKCPYFFIYFHVLAAQYDHTFHYFFFVLNESFKVRLSFLINI